MAVIIKRIENSRDLKRVCEHIKDDFQGASIMVT